MVTPDVLQPDPPDRRARGFSLIELLIVVAIIGIISAIAIPAVLNSKQAAHNASAIGSLKIIHTAQIAYRARSPQFATLAQLSDAGTLTDPLLKTGNKSNYVFVINEGTLGPDNFEVTASPTVSPWRYYYMNGSGIIRSNLGSPANADSPPVRY
jgi:prepilin-type N-terminal cleavage/methylation domain-containing protein